MNEEMVESIEAVAEEKRYSPEVEEASERFTNAIPEFKRILRKVKSMNSLARVFMAAAEFPLSKEYPKFNTEAEIQLFLAFNDLLEYKSLIVSTFMKDMLEKERKISTEKGAVNE